MCLRINPDIQITAVTFMKRESFFRAVSDIILDSIVKGACKFGNTFAFKIDQTVNSFNLPEKNTILLGKIYCSNKTFVTQCIHINSLFFSSSITCLSAYVLTILPGCGLCNIIGVPDWFLKTTLEPDVFPLFERSNP